MALKILIAVIAFGSGWLVERNNPNIAAVNKLITAGKLVVDEASKLLKKL